MARANQETVTTFGEVLHSANIFYLQNRMNTPDNRLIFTLGVRPYEEKMIFF